MGFSPGSWGSSKTQMKKPELVAGTVSSRASRPRRRKPLAAVLALAAVTAAAKGQSPLASFSSSGSKGSQTVTVENPKPAKA